MVEGEKSVGVVLRSDYTVRKLVGTLSFLSKYSIHIRPHTSVFQADEKILGTLGTLVTNREALAVVEMPEESPVPSEGVV